MYLLTRYATKSSLAAIALLVMLVFWLTVLFVGFGLFAIFSVLYLKEQLTWNHAFGFALIAVGAAFVFSART
jgi:uncharacterized protein (DUF486 family)